MLEWSELWQAATALGSVGALALSVYAILTARNRRDVGELIDTKNRHETRLAKLETEVAHLPGVQTVHELQLSMTEMKGQLAVIVERVAPIQAIAERLQENLLEHGR
jgi:hypothetical protein